MSVFQKMIKMAATFFAIFLTVAIISGIGKAAFEIIRVFTESGEQTVSQILENYDGEAIRNLDIDNAVGKLVIKAGENFQVEGISVGGKFKSEISKKGTLRIKSKGILTGRLVELLNGTLERKEPEVTISVPEDFEFNEIIIDSGVGELNVEGISFKELDLDCGIGDIYLLLNGEVSDYNFNIDSGIGTIYLDGEKISDTKIKDKSARSTVEIDGGIGDVYISFSGQ